MSHDPRLTVRDIDMAIKQSVDDGLVDISVSLQWNYYQDLLVLKGLDATTAAKESWGYGNEKRPLKEFQGYPLQLTGSGSQVLGSTPDGAITGRVIIIRFTP